jgi:hypothetical protein
VAAAAVVGGHNLVASGGTAGLVVEACSYVKDSAEDVVADIPGVSATASEGTAARSLGAGTHLAVAAAAAEYRAHIGRWDMAAGASADYAADPWLR